MTELQDSGAPSHAEAAHAAILSEARRRFLFDGFAGTGIAEIARRAGVSATTIYRLASSKEALFERVIDEANESYRQRVSEISAPREGTLHERLKALVERHIGLMIETEQHAVLQKVLAVVPRFPDLARRTYQAQLESMHQQVAADLDVFVREGLLAEHNTAHGAPLLMGIAREVCQLTPLLHGDLPSAEKLAEGIGTVVYTFAEGLRPEGVSRSPLPVSLQAKAAGTEDDIFPARQFESDWEPMSDRQREILLAAREVFFERGFNLTGVAEIAEAAGVSVASIYREFESKEQLFVDVVEDLYDQIASECEKQVGPTSLPLADEMMVLCINIGAILYRMESHALFRMIVSERASLPEEAVAAMRTGAEHRYHLIGRYLRDKIGEGALIDHDTVEFGRAQMGISREFFGWPGFLDRDIELPPDAIDKLRMLVAVYLRAFGTDD